MDYQARTARQRQQQRISALGVLLLVGCETSSFSVNGADSSTDAIVVPDQGAAGGPIDGPSDRSLTARTPKPACPTPGRRRMPIQ